MLRNNFYSVLKQEAGLGSVNTTIMIHQDHAIFNGHFPGHPVVPGVCMMQIVRELLEDTERKKLNMVAGDTIKFLAVLDPSENNEVNVVVQFTFTGNTYAVQASIFLEQVTYFKFKGSFQEVSWNL